MGFLPNPLVSIHSLGALAKQIDVHNTRLLTKRAHEDSSGPSANPLADSQTGSSPPGASSAVGVDPPEMNQGMAIALQLLIGELATDLVDQAWLLPVAVLSSALPFCVCCLAQGVCLPVSSICLAVSPEICLPRCRLAGSGPQDVHMLKAGRVLSALLL